MPKAKLESSQTKLKKPQRHHDDKAIDKGADKSAHFVAVGAGQLDFEAAFAARYKGLNPAQKRAVDTVEGPVMVIAGPGTGKTTILTLRIANILRKTQVGPGAILALTFTETGVKAMRRKLTELIGPAAHKVHIHTFHSFANECIIHHPHAFPRIVGGVAATDIDKIQIIEEILKNDGAGAAHGITFQKLKPFGNPEFYVKHIKGAISECKREGVLPGELARHTERLRADFEAIPDLTHTKGAHAGKMKGKYSTLLEKIRATEELAIVYAAYEAELALRHLYDFEDMINEAVHVLSHNEEMLLAQQEKYQYILADEHQDANWSQNRLLELLSGFFERPNLFIVGDEKQAIFRFQGASLENFMYFKRRFPSAEIITLTENYRSTQGILDGAHGVILNNPAADPMLRARLEAKGVSGGKSKSNLQIANDSQISNQKIDTPLAQHTSIDFAALPSVDDERLFLVDQVRRAVDERSVCAGEIAILVRKNNDARALARTFRAEHIPFALHVDADFFDDYMVAQFLDLLRAVAYFGEPTYVARLLVLPMCGVAPLDAWKLTRFADTERVSLFDIITRGTVGEALARAGIERGSDSAEAIGSLGRNLIEWARGAADVSLVELIERIKNDSGIMPYILSQYDADEAALKLASLSAIISEAELVLSRERKANLKDFLAHIDRLAEYGIGLPVNIGLSNAHTDRIHIMTVHRSKGLEFDEVFILGANENNWNGRGMPNYFILPDGRPEGGSGGVSNQIADTADDDLVETNRIADERRLFYVALTRARHHVHISYALEKEGKELEPSRFLAEIDPALVNRDAAAAEVKEWLAGRAERMQKKEIAINSTAGEDSDGGTAGPTAAMLDFARTALLDRGLSVSAINNYIDCPWKFFFNNLLRLPQIKEPHQLYGTAMHAGLEYLYATLNAYWQKERETPPELGEVIAQFEHSLKKTPLGAERYEAARTKGREALTAYFGQRMPELMALPAAARPAFRTEAKYNAELAIDGLGVLPLHGIIDRLDTMSDGSVRVTDYKTGKRHTLGDIMGTTASSDGNIWRQAVFYRFLIGLSREAEGVKSGEVVPSQVSIDFIEHYENGASGATAATSTKSKSSKPPIELLTVGDENVAELKEEILPLISEMAKLDFWGKPCDDVKCEHCMLARRAGWIV